MVSERIDVRLDREQRQKLDDMAHRRGVSASKVIRDAIDRLYELDDRERRLEAVRRIAAMELEDVPDPEELSRQLDSTYEIGPV